MKEVLILTLFLGSYNVTSYRSEESQTDKTPLITASNEYVHPNGVAVHPSLLCPRIKYKMGNRYLICKRGNQCKWHKDLHYGDLIYIESVGFKFVNDCMAWGKWDDKHNSWVTKMNSRFDVWVKSKEDEQKFHGKYKNRKLKVWMISNQEN